MPSAAGQYFWLWELLGASGTSVGEAGQAETGPALGVVAHASDVVADDVRAASARFSAPIEAVFGFEAVVGEVVIGGAFEMDGDDPVGGADVLGQADRSDDLGAFLWA